MRQRVLLKGLDGIDLIHRISTLDLKKLTPHTARSGLILNPKGKIISEFEVKLLDSDELEIQFEKGFLELLEQFTFSEKYQIIPLPSIFEPSLSEKERILSLKPKLNFEYRLDGESNPLEVNLGEAISDQKGCYPGQEIIEKIVAIGSSAKKLCLLSTDGTPGPVPLPLFDQNQNEVGTLTSYFEGKGLALIKRTHLKIGTRVENKGLSFTLEKIAP